MTATDTPKDATLRQMLNLIETELALKSDHCLQLPSKEADAL